MSYPQTTSVLSSRKKKDTENETHHRLFTSKYGCDLGPLVKRQGLPHSFHSPYLPSEALGTPFLPQPFPRNFAFMLGAFVSTTHFSTSSATWLKTSLPHTVSNLIPSHLSPTHSFASKVSGMDSLLLTLLSPCPLVRSLQTGAILTIHSS